MKRIGIMGLCLVALFAMSAVVTASASAALPEFTGPFPKLFTSTSTKTKIEAVGKIVGRLRITCTAGTNVGEVTGPQAVFVRFTFTGCEELPGKVLCTDTFVPGVLEFNELKGTLGYINAMNKEVGLEFENAIPSFTTVIPFGCGELAYVISSSVIGKIAPVDTRVRPSRRFSLKFKQARGKQQLTKLEGGPIDVLESTFSGGPIEDTGLASSDALTFAEAVEIKA